MIAYVLGTFPQLSETFIENELRVLDGRGVQLRVVALDRPPAHLAGGTALGGVLAYVPGRGAQLVAFSASLLRRPVRTTGNVTDALRHRSKMMMRAAVAAPWIARHLRPYGIRLVHAHFATDGGSAAMAVARLLDRPFTFTAHARDIYVRTRGLCLRASRAAAVVTVCEYNVEQLRRRCPALGRDAIELVYCGVDPDAFPLRSEPPPSDALRLLAVGRLVEKKGFGDLLDAVAILAAAGRSIELAVIGGGPLLGALQAQVDELGLGSSVALPGPQPPEEVAAALARCDVFVLPCIVDREGDRDSMPVVIKEAMARGVPVVSTREVAVPEMVDETVGRLCPPSDPRALAAAIAEIADLDPVARRRLGVAGHQRVRDRFDVRSETTKLQELFDRLAG